MFFIKCVGHSVPKSAHVAFSMLPPPSGGTLHGGRGTYSLSHDPQIVRYRHAVRRAAPPALCAHRPLLPPTATTLASRRPSNCTQGIQNLCGDTHRTLITATTTGEPPPQNAHQLYMLRAGGVERRLPYTGGAPLRASLITFGAGHHQLTCAHRPCSPQTRRAPRRTRQSAPSASSTTPSLLLASGWRRSGCRRAVRGASCRPA